MYEAKEVGLSDADDHKAILTFCALVNDLFPSAIEGWERELSKLTEEQWPFLHDIIVDFNRLRNFRKARNALTASLSNKAPRSQGSSFPTLGGKDEHGRKRDWKPKNNNDNIPTCLCRDKHFYSRCPYLNPQLAPPGFRRDRQGDLRTSSCKRFWADTPRSPTLATSERSALPPTPESLIFSERQV